MYIAFVLWLACAFAMPVNPLEPDWDKDGIPTEDDNCPTRKNHDQKDTNKNGVGDACDCFDGIKGPNEQEKDCGGMCTKQCYTCQPLRKSGDSKDKIDIVFVPDVDYNGDYVQFVKDANAMIDKGYFNNTVYSANKCKWNFWYVARDGDYRGVCAAWDLPTGFAKVCPFADGTVILFRGSDRACSSSIFSAPAISPPVIVHETGHKIFGLKDEYCCDGGYGQAATFPNVYETKAQCVAKSLTPNTCNNNCPETKCWPGTSAKCSAWAASKGLNAYECNCTLYAKAKGFDPNLCKATAASACPSRWSQFWTNRGITNTLSVISPHWCNYRSIDTRLCCVNGGDGWWMADPANDTMAGSVAFGPDCKRRINDRFGDFAQCSAPTPKFSGGTVKTVVVSGVMGPNGVRLNHVSFVYSAPPSNIINTGEFQWTVASRTGDVVERRDMNDPREFHSHGSSRPATFVVPRGRRLLQASTIPLTGRPTPFTGKLGTRAPRPSSTELVADDEGDDHFFATADYVPFEVGLPWLGKSDASITLREKQTGKVMLTVPTKDLQDALLEFCQGNHLPTDTECSGLLGAQAQSGRCCVVDRQPTGTKPTNCAALDARPRECGGTNGACFWDVNVPKCCEMAQAVDTTQKCGGDLGKCTELTVGGAGSCQSREVLIRLAEAKCGTGRTVDIATLEFQNACAEGVNFAGLKFECCLTPTRKPCTNGACGDGGVCISDLCEVAKVPCGNNRDCPSHSPFCKTGFCSSTAPPTKCPGYSSWGCRTVAAWRTFANRECVRVKMTFSSVLVDESATCGPDAAGVSQFVSARWQCCPSATTSGFIAGKGALVAGKGALATGKAALTAGKGAFVVGKSTAGKAAASAKP